MVGTRLTNKLDGYSEHTLTVKIWEPPDLFPIFPVPTSVELYTTSSISHVSCWKRREQQSFPGIKNPGRFFEPFGKHPANVSVAKCLERVLESNPTIIRHLNAMKRGMNDDANVRGKVYMQRVFFRHAYT